MKKNIFQHQGKNAHWFEIEGDGPFLHFNHANGYSFGTYRQFLKGLSPHFQVFGLAHRATWENIGDPQPKITWMDYADDLIFFLESTGKTPVIGMGHSLGAITTLMAAVKRPDLFSKLILIESTLMFPLMWGVFRSLPLSMKHEIQLIHKTLHRPDTWNSPDECIAFHQDKKNYRRFSKQSMQDFAAYGLVSDKNGAYRLSFPKEWEAHVYCTYPFVWRFFKSVKLPALVIRGRLSDVISRFSWNLLKVVRSDMTFVELPRAGHLVPFEVPERVGEVAVNWFLSTNG